MEGGLKTWIKQEGPHCSQKKEGNHKFGCENRYFKDATMLLIS